MTRIERVNSNANFKDKLSLFEVNPETEEITILDKETLERIVLEQAELKLELLKKDPLSKWFSKSRNMNAFLFAMLLIIAFNVGINYFLRLPTILTSILALLTCLPFLASMMYYYYQDDKSSIQAIKNIFGDEK